MRTICTRLAVIAGTAAAATAQLSQFTAITSSAVAHEDAKICTDALHVAFRTGTASLGVVDIAGVAEATLYTSPTLSLTSYVWSRDSAVIYLSDGNQILRVPVGGGAATPVATVAGSEVRLSCIDPTGTLLYGTRKDTGGPNAHLFQVPAAGGTPTDVVNRAGNIDSVDIDETGQYVLLRQWSGASAVPATFERYDAVANASLPMITVNQLALSAHWITAGSFFTVAMPSAAHPFGSQIARIAATGTVDFLVDEGFTAKRPYFPGTGEEIVFETDDPLFPGGTAVGMVPNHGGAVIFTCAGQPLFVNVQNGVVQDTGGLTVDPAITKIALCASTWLWQTPQIFVADIDETLHVHQKLQIGGTFQIDANVGQGVIGAAAVANGLTTGLPITLPGIANSLWLDPTPGNLAIVLSGVGTAAGGVGGNYPIPFNPALRGLRLWVQALELDQTFTGSFTHFGYFRVF
jgi:hypothetical protein